MINVAIFGVPRSGTSWLGQIFNSSQNVAYRFQPLFSYEFKNKLNVASTSDDIQDFHSKLLQAESDFVLTEKVFTKTNITHLVWKEVRYHNLASLLLQKSDLKIIYISRDPIEVINSWYNAPREFLPNWNIREEWFYANLKNQGRAEEFYGMQGWLKAENIHNQNKFSFPDRVMIIKYSDLLSDTEGEVKKIFLWLNLKWSTSTSEYIENTLIRTSTDVYSTRKSPAKLNLPEDIISQIRKHNKTQNNNNENIK